MPNTIRNAEGADTMAGGVKEASVVDFESGEIVPIPSLGNNEGKCWIDISTTYPRTVSDEETYTCSWYNPLTR